MIEQSNVVADLPLGVFVCHFACYLTVKEIGKLDAAFCSYSERGKLIALLTDEASAFVLDSKMINNIAGCMNWSVIRNIRFNKLRLSECCPIGLLLPASFFNVQCNNFIEVYDEHRNGSEALKAMHNMTGKFNSLLALEIRTSIEPKNAAKLLRKCPTLQKLCIYRADRSLESCFTRVSCPNVVSVSLICNGWEHKMQGFSKCFPNVEKLVLESRYNYTENEFAAIDLRIFQRLSELTLKRTDITDEQLEIIASSCADLTHLTLEFCYRLSVNSIVALCNHCKKIASLSLLYYYVGAAGGTILQPEVLIAIANNLHGTLKYLSVAKCTITNITNLAVLKQCTLLESLDISSAGPTGARHSGLTELLISLRNLLTIRMNGVCVPDSVLCAIGEHCSNIEHIPMIRATGYTSAGILAIAQHTHKPRTLTIDWSPVCVDLVTMMPHLFSTCTLSAHISTDC